MGQPNEGTPSHTWKLMQVKWLGLFLILLALSYGLKIFGPMPLWLKLLIETIILIPTIAYVITPLMDSLFSEWLYAGIDREQQRKSVDIGS